MWYEKKLGGVDMKKLAIGIAVVFSLIGGAKVEASPVHDHEASLIASALSDKYTTVEASAHALGQEVYDVRYGGFVIFMQWMGDTVVASYKSNGEHIDTEVITDTKVKDVIEEWKRDGLLVNKVIIQYEENEECVY